MDKEAFSNAVSVVKEYYGTHEYSDNRIATIDRALKILARCMEATPPPDTLEEALKSILKDASIPKYLKVDVRHLIPMLYMAMETGRTESRMVSTRKPVSLAPKLADLFAVYSAYLHKIYTVDNTINFHIRSVEWLLTYLTIAGITDISQVECHHLDSFVTSGMKGFKPGTKQAVVYRLRKFLHYLYLHDHISARIAIQYDDVRIKVPQNVVTVLPDKHADGIVGSDVKGNSKLTRDKAIALCALLLGLRQSDILKLKMEDIDWDNMTVSIIQQKTKKYLKLPLPGIVAYVILKYISEYRPDNEEGFIFHKVRGPYNRLETAGRRNFLHLIDEDASDIPEGGCHLLRRTFASRHVGKESIVTIMNMLGQSSLSCLDKYVNIDTDNMPTAAIQDPPFSLPEVLR